MSEKSNLQNSFCVERVADQLPNQTYIQIQIDSEFNFRVSLHAKPELVHSELQLKKIADVSKNACFGGSLNNAGGSLAFCIDRLIQIAKEIYR